MNLPLPFVEHTKSLLGNQWDAFRQALCEQPSPVSVRLNPIKAKAKNLADALRPVPWSNLGYYLPQRPSFTFDPLFHAGIYYVQEASSMFIEQAFWQHISGEVQVLDLCAAPGGKSTHVASLVDAQSVVVCNEVISSRANILLENVLKSGFENTIVTNSDPAVFGRLGGIFDVILVDAPCSGEGMFRKDPNAIGEWSENNVQLCSERQRRILRDVWGALKQDGWLIYSTCTYNRCENEDNVQWIATELGAEVVPVQTHPDWGIITLSDELPCYRFMPHSTQGEGFFMALLRKTADATSPSVKRKSKTKPQIAPSGVRDYLSDYELLKFEEVGGKWRAYPPSVQQILEHLEGVKILNAGIPLGEQKGKDFVPEHALALSNRLNIEAFTTVSLTREQAISYLRKENFTLPDAPKGYVLLIYQETPIGIVKNLGNRVNSLLPNEWRIRNLSSDVGAHKLEVFAD